MNKYILTALLSTVATANLAFGKIVNPDDYSKNYSSYLSKWEADLARRNGRVPADDTPLTEPAQKKASRSYSPWATPDSTYRVEKESYGLSGLVQSISVEGFYAIANEHIFSNDDDLDKMDIAGITLQHTFRNNDSSSESMLPNFEFFYSGSLGYGNDELKGEDWKDEYSVIMGLLSVGSNLYWEVTPGWEFFVGARVGLSYIFVENEYNEPEYRESINDDAFGLLYGARIGTAISFTPNHALTLAFDYWGSTARAEFYDVKTKEQSYCVFSVGYKYSF